MSARAAKESLDLIQNAYENGAVTITQLIDAQRTYFSAEQAKSNAYYGYLIYTLQLERAMGYFFLLHTDEENEQFIQDFIQFYTNKK